MKESNAYFDWRRSWRRLRKGGRRNGKGNPGGGGAAAAISNAAFCTDLLRRWRRVGLKIPPRLSGSLTVGGRTCTDTTSSSSSLRFDF